jgi:hypothetical protein
MFSEIYEPIFQFSHTKICISFFVMFIISNFISFHLFFDTIFTIDSHELTFSQLIVNTTSQFIIPDFSAILHFIGLSTNHSFFINNHDFIACSYVGISFNSRFVSIFVFIQIGFIQVKNNIENIIVANRKFIKTQASIIIDCCQAGLFIKLYDALFSFSFINIIFFSDSDILILPESYIFFQLSISFSKSSLLYNSFFSLYIKKVFGISHVNFTNQPNGSQFNE